MHNSTRRPHHSINHHHHDISLSLSLFLASREKHNFFFSNYPPTGTWLSRAATPDTLLHLPQSLPAPLHTPLQGSQPLTTLHPLTDPARCSPRPCALTHVSLAPSSTILLSLRLPAFTSFPSSPSILPGSSKTPPLNLSSNYLFR